MADAVDAALAPAVAGARVVAEPKAAEADHVAFLDGLRGFAAAYVLLGHAMNNLPGGAPSRIETALRMLFGQGHYAVDVFIVLSGYCLALPVVARNRTEIPILPFLRRRAVRIIPTYYFALLLSYGLIVTLIGGPTNTHWGHALPVTTRDLVLHFLLIHDWFESSALKVNHALWSVGVEWKIYFLFPALVALQARRGAWAMALAALIGGYAAWGICAWFDLANPSPTGASFYYVGLFAMGMAAASLGGAGVTGRSRRQARLALIGLLVTTALLGAATILKGKHAVPVQIRSFFIGGWTSLAIVLLRSGKLRPLGRLLSSPPAVALGKGGYSIYLVHAPILQLVWLYVIAPAALGPFTRGPAMLLACAAVSAIVIWPFYVLAERPFHHLSRRV